MLAPCVSAMACTIDSPRPKPSPWLTRSAASRWNGWKRRSTAAGGTVGPVLATETTARPSRVPVLTSTRPPGTLWRSALSSRFATRRSARRGLPAAGAAPSAACSVRFRSAASAWRDAMTGPVTAARSKGSRSGRPACPVARVSSASMRCCCSAPAARTRSCAVRSDSTVAPGSARATWLMTRWRASGVRSSCEALAMNWRWARNDASSRASSPSKVSPSSLSSSSGPRRARRSLRLVTEICRAAAVMVRTGRSVRPATSQPSATESTAIRASAISDRVRSSCRTVPFSARAMVCACCAPIAWHPPPGAWHRALPALGPTKARTTRT